ncbi:OLC1v1009418C1 [Oldenlandia corymbosa var. corymbosa]|uniref:OLC1v1009418C1 n=1 Tax=Oldenlandia corymbosa var. corymbosa TaxID=529605 RepID=A0AAV1DRU1_OLDCO|nr:OLC1v1009418C1 [Oldenlandia corymbosa var. corymbosa]
MDLKISGVISPFRATNSVGPMSAAPKVNRWIRPEVFPLFAAVGVAVGICGMQLVRNICTNPEVRVTKENRSAGILDNFKEGEKYSQHAVRKYVRHKSPQIMPAINRWFSDPQL